jgi:hypothetical protein
MSAIPEKSISPHRHSGEGRNPCFVLAMDSGLRRNDGEGVRAFRQLKAAFQSRRTPGYISLSIHAFSIPIVMRRHQQADTLFPV